jgi:type III secretory pathway component EscS
MSIRERILPALRFLIWGILLGLAYGQAPLYTSNQNQYFLHGLAQAGQGLLAEDWLANTTDPTPVFSWLVVVTARYLPRAIFYLYYFLLFAVYLYSLRHIANRLFDIDRSRTMRWVFLALLIVSHSAGLHLLLRGGIGGDWEYLFDGGFAGQRLLGTVLQPSSFGVFLLLSVQQFLEDRPYRAVLAAAVAATVHPTFLLSAGVLTLAYVFVEIRAGKGYRRPIQTGGLALILVLPILVYSSSSFLPTAADARDVLVHFRLPAHAIVSEWFGFAAVAAATLIGVALYLARGTRLLPVLLISAVAGATLTLLQLLTDSDALALLFPWRLSTYLVPISVAVLAGWFSVWLVEHTGQRFGRIAPAVSIVLIGLSILSGLIWMAVQGLQGRIAPENALYEYVRGAREPAQVYAIPPGLQDFRLETGAPILADFKSIPYRRGEVINWHDRVRLLQWFYRDEINCGLMDNFTAEYGVTHMVLGPEQVGQVCPEMSERYNDGHYAVYELEPPR